MVLLGNFGGNNFGFEMIVSVTLWWGKVWAFLPSWNRESSRKSDRVSFFKFHTLDRQETLSERGITPGGSLFSSTLLSTRKQDGCSSVQLFLHYFSSYGFLLRGFQALLVRLHNEIFSLQFRLLCLCVVVRFGLFVLASEIHHQGSDPSCRNSVWLTTY